MVVIAQEKHETTPGQQVVNLTETRGETEIRETEIRDTEIRGNQTHETYPRNEIQIGGSGHESSDFGDDDEMGADDELGGSSDLISEHIRIIETRRQQDSIHTQHQLRAGCNSWVGLHTQGLVEASDAAQPSYLETMPIPAKNTGGSSSFRGQRGSLSSSVGGGGITAIVSAPPVGPMVQSSDESELATAAKYSSDLAPSPGVGGPPIPPYAALGLPRPADDVKGGAAALRTASPRRLSDRLKGAVSPPGGTGVVGPGAGSGPPGGGGWPSVSSVGCETGAALTSTAGFLPSYVKLQLPSHELAIRAQTETETVDAVKMLISALCLRDRFIHKFPDLDSPVVFPCRNNDNNRISKEPVYRPYDCPRRKNLQGHVRFIDGVAHVYTNMKEEQAGSSSKSTTSSTDKSEKPAMKEETKSLPSTTAGDGETDTNKGDSGVVEEEMEDLSRDIPAVDTYLAALKQLMLVAMDPACKSLAYQRLRYLEEKFSFHLLFNGAQEVADVRSNNHRDFYNVRKVDTHVHHSACMNQKHLLRFIRNKYVTEGDTVVAVDKGVKRTLKDIFDRDLGLTGWDASIDHLNVQALNSCYQRFDIFNSKYNPFGAVTLRDVFLKTDNHIEGRFLAELTREVLDDMEEKKYQHAEWRISIYGRSREEWSKLAKWVKNNNLVSKRVRWHIQVPRLYHVYRRRGMLKSMGEFIENVFQPLIEAVLRPEDHPEIYEMLFQTVGWDSVDDESKMSQFTTAGGKIPLPAEWTQEDNPPYAYWIYYMYANIRALNLLLEKRGMRTMAFRPHCGEAGSISHLGTAALLADGINHGIVLRKSPVLQYLYYVWQVGIAMSPLSNNAIFHELAKSPFNSFFRIGLNVSLSTDDPLMFHFTDEALLEEYSVCAHFWKLSPADLCEIARNSVLQSGFEPQFKRHWLGPNYHKRGRKGNNITCTNLPNVRVQYREDTLKEELRFLRDVIIRCENIEEDNVRILRTPPVSRHGSIHLHHPIPQQQPQTSTNHASSTLPPTAMSSVELERPTYA